MEDIPSDSYSSPASSSYEDGPDEISLKMNLLRMEEDLPPLNSKGEQYPYKQGQIRLIECHWPASPIQVLVYTLNRVKILNAVYFLFYLVTVGCLTKFS